MTQHRRHAVGGRRRRLGGLFAQAARPAATSPRHVQHRHRRRLDLHDGQRRCGVRRWPDPYRQRHGSAADGTSHLVTVTITGTNDAALLSWQRDLARRRIWRLSNMATGTLTIRRRPRPPTFVQRGFWYGGPARLPSTRPAPGPTRPATPMRRSMRSATDTLPDASRYRSADGTSTFGDRRRLSAPTTRRSFGRRVRNLTRTAKPGRAASDERRNVANLLPGARPRPRHLQRTSPAPGPPLNNADAAVDALNNRHDSFTVLSADARSW